MEPLRIDCQLQGSICHPPMIDSMLMALQARADGLPPIDRTTMVVADIPIPIAVEPAGRFHLCTSPQFAEIASEVHWKNRRFPVEQAAKLGDPNKVKRVAINAGPEKSYRIPHSVSFIEGNRITWWCLGDADGIRALLRYSTHVGKFTGVGKGRVKKWEVARCDSWDGFPVVRCGKPMRPLPTDWPGLVDPELAYSVLGTIGQTYWDNTRRVLCAVPE